MRRLRVALAHISAKLRVAFQMREVAGLTTKETAKALNISESSVKSRVRRARAAIGLYLETSGGSDGQTTN